MRLSASLFAVFPVAAWAACNFSVDPNFVGPASLDGGANNVTDMDSSTSDAGTFDGGASTGGNDAGAQSCERQDDCQPGQVCVALSRWGQKTCMPRCLEDGTCWGSEAADREVTFASDGTNICYALGATQDPDGLEMLRNATVSQWNVTSAPRELATGYVQAQAKLIADANCYFATERGLERIPVDVAGLPERLNPDGGTVLRAWSTPAFVYWSVTKDWFSFELWRVHRTNRSAPERLQTDASFIWSTGNDSVVFGRTNVPQRPWDNAVSAAISDLNQTHQFASTLTPLYVDGNDLYLGSESNTTRVERLDISDSNATAVVVIDPPVYSTQAFFAFARDWLYWAELQDGTSQRFSRYFRIPTKASLPQVEVLRVPVEQETRSAPFAVFKNYLVHVRQNFVAASPITPAPCNDKLECAFGTTCNADSTCK